MSFNRRKVKLTSGGEVSVRAKYDPLKASKPDRDLVAALVEMLAAYEANQVVRLGGDGE